MPKEKLAIIMAIGTTLGAMNTFARPTTCDEAVEAYLMCKGNDGGDASACDSEKSDVKRLCGSSGEIDPQLLVSIFEENARANNTPGDITKSTSSQEKAAEEDQQSDAVKAQD